MGADAVLLIAECLDDGQLRMLHDEIVSLGMTPLVELYEPAVAAGAGNRCVALSASITATCGPLRSISSTRSASAARCAWSGALVGASGIRNRTDVEILQKAGVEAMLAGETLMASADIGAAVDELLGSSTGTPPRCPRPSQTADGTRSVPATLCFYFLGSSVAHGSVCSA